VEPVIAPRLAGYAGARMANGYLFPALRVHMLRQVPLGSVDRLMGSQLLGGGRCKARTWLRGYR
jgi:hypothetical protein